jgi:uncharacterized protein (DUF58 family)
MRQTLALRWTLVALLILGLVGWIVTGSPLYARLLYLSVFLLVGSGVWTVFSTRGIRLKRDARTLRASMGDVFEERFEVANSTWPGCMWLEVINQSPLPAAGRSATGSRLLTFIGARQKRFYSTRTLLVQRGEFLLGPTEINFSDPFGLFNFHRHLDTKETLVVLPMTFPISTFPPPPGILPGGKTIRQRTMDVTPHAAGVREYVPGDPMKRIHWPSTAHRGRFMVKEFEQDPQADIWLFLDAQRELLVDQTVAAAAPEDESWWLRRMEVVLPRNTFEYAVSAAASLARYFLGEKRAVGLACEAGKLIVVSAERGERQVGKILETLAFLQPEGSMPLLGLVTMQAKLLPLGSGVVLITTATKPELLLAVEDLQRRNLRPIVVLIKAETFGGLVGSEDIVTSLLNRNIPVCPIAYGDNLAVQLALPAIYYQRPYLSRSFFFARS